MAKLATHTPTQLYMPISHQAMPTTQAATLDSQLDWQHPQHNTA